MATRVLANEEAHAAITKMQSIISSGLEDQVLQLDQQGQTLSNPNNWDGPLAIEFRNNVWPQCNQALQNAVKELEQLQGRLQTIHKNIMEAGGGH